MRPEDWITGFIRVSNAIIWTIFVLQVYRADRPLIRLARKALLPVIGIGMWMFVLGWLATINVIPGWVARDIYTIFTAFAGIIAIALVTGQVTED